MTTTKISVFTHANLTTSHTTNNMHLIYLLSIIYKSTDTSTLLQSTVPPNHHSVLLNHSRPQHSINIIRMYSVSQTKQDTQLVSITLRNINHFQNSFTAGLSTKLATKWSLHIPPHFKDIAALSWELVMFQNCINSTIQYWRNVVLKFMQIHLINILVSVTSSF